MEPKPCPFCGSTDLEVDDEVEKSTVYCEKCDIDGPTGEDKDEAIELWNRRISTPPYLNRVNPFYSKELEIAISVWIALFQEGEFTRKRAYKEQISKCVRSQYEKDKLSENAIERISILVNPDKGKLGGATPSE